MALRDRHNFRAHYTQDTLPCDGVVGDIVVLTPLSDDDHDPEPQGSVSIWFCIKADEDGRPALWARLEFDGVATCEQAVPRPPQTHPQLIRG